MSNLDFFDNIDKGRLEIYLNKSLLQESIPSIITDSIKNS
jgi:hypothetical protein